MRSVKDGAFWQRALLSAATASHPPQCYVRPVFRVCVVAPGRWGPAPARTRRDPATAIRNALAAAWRWHGDRCMAYLVCMRTRVQSVENRITGGRSEVREPCSDRHRDGAYRLG
jgi:hypothetical protein